MRGDRKKKAGSHEPERVPGSAHTATTTAYRLLCPGHVRAAHGIRILPDWISSLRMPYRKCLEIYTVIAPPLSRKKARVMQWSERGSHNRSHTETVTWRFLPDFGAGGMPFSSPLGSCGATRPLAIGEPGRTLLAEGLTPFCGVRGRPGLVGSSQALDAVLLKSPCACRLERQPPLTQGIKWRLGVSQGATRHAASLAMLRKAWPFLREVLHGGVTHSLAYCGRCRGPWQALPGAVALQRPLREAFLPRGAQPAATRVAEVPFQGVVRPRQTWHVIAGEQARPSAPADRVEGQTTLREGRRGLGPPAHRVKRPTQWSRDLCSAQRTGGWRFSEVGEVTEPGSALLTLLGGLGTGR